jgi:hypothetical protein
MNAILRTGVCALFALLGASPASAQDVEVILVMRVDETLAEAVNKVAAAGSVKVEVEKSLRKKHVSLLLDDGIEDALKRLAKAAGAHLVKTGPKSWRIQAAAPKDGENVESGESAIPGWARPLAEKLAKTEVSYRFAGERLPEVLAWLAGKAGVPIRLDPRVLKERTKEAIEIHIAAYDANMNPEPCTTSAESALGAVLAYPGLDCSWAWLGGGVYVSTRERIEALPRALLPAADDAEEEADAALRAKVGTTKVTVKLTGAKLDKAIREIARKGKVKVVLDSKIARAFSADRIDLEIDDLPLADALALVLLPRGLVLEFGRGRLTVRRGED